MKRKKKLLLLITFFALISCFLVIIFDDFNREYIYIIETDKIAIIDEINIYGNHLNLNGTIDVSEINYNNITELNLLLYAENPIEVPLKYKITEENIYFELADKINNGFLLDDIDINNYHLYIEANNNETKEYYKLKNNTSYETTEYFSIRNDNKLKKMQFSNKNDTINLDVQYTKDNNIYDVVIDPGHGGIDKGACSNNYCETDFTYLISSKIKTKLEERGLKVKLTRDDLNSDEKLSNYGQNGRVNIANDSKAKYLLAIHLNSNDYKDHGLEIYTAYNVDYTFASNLASHIKEKANTNYSTNNAFKKQDGVYTRTLQDIDLKENKETAIANGYKPYDVSYETTYYFIIRETGGYMSGAYKDGRDGGAYNYYFDSNVGIESYLLELGYLTSKDDVINLKNNLDNYVDGIVESLLEELESE